MILITIYCHITKKINIIASIQDKNKYSTFKISYIEAPFLESGCGRVV